MWEAAKACNGRIFRWAMACISRATRERPGCIWDCGRASRSRRFWWIRTIANRLFVAVLGHPYGPNAERGIYRSTDGGRHFEKVLYKDENTGGMDLAFDPKDAQIVYAVLWAGRQAPWENGRVIQRSGQRTVQIDGWRIDVEATDEGTADA